MTSDIRIFSPKTVLVEPTVCANFECPSPDELSMTRKVQGGSTLHFGTGHYHGEARERIDLHLKVMEPTTNVIAIEHSRPFADNKWNQANPLISTTSQGLNVSIRLLNKCDYFYHGKRCGRYCIPSPNRHWECSDEGERQCAAGWTGVDCSNPICPEGCNGRGRCVSPGKCSCIEGFNLTQCDQCIPRAGCLHGGCLNRIPNTCKCNDGFIGDKWDIDINICSIQKPCVNGGRCSIDSSSGNGFKCDCPFAFLGVRCGTPLAKVKCVSADHVCKNAISLDFFVNGKQYVSEDDVTVGIGQFVTVEVSIISSLAAEYSGNLSLECEQEISHLLGSNDTSNFMLVTGAKKVPFTVDKENKQSAFFSITFIVEGSFRVRPQITPAPGQNALLAEDMFATPVAFSVSAKFQ